MKKENLLDYIAYHEKWHSKSQNYRHKYVYNTNDFLLKEIFKRLKIETGTFVEFGAWDGIHLSNTKLLFDDGWKGLLIESNSERFSQLKENYKNSNVCVDNSFLNLSDCLFDDVYNSHLSDDIDFCSIDIDGLDLEIFETFNKNLPKVICIEGGQVLHPLQDRVSIEIASKNVQQSLLVMKKSFEEKGYKLLCSYQDCIFIKKEYFDLFDVEEDVVKNYVDGLICLPRIPYILNLLSDINYENEIIDIATKGIPKTITDHVRHANLKEKKYWIDCFYSLIKDNLLSFRESL